MYIYITPTMSFRLHIHPSPSTHMDRFFPLTNHDSHELQLIMLIHYVVSTSPVKPGFFVVKVKNSELNATTPPGTILVPNHYKDHLQCFLWRHQVFMEVVHQYNDKELHLVPYLSPLFQHYIVYMDGVAEDLLTTARKMINNPSYRSLTFDLYLVVEYFIQRHESHIAAQWRGNNPDVILECQDAFQLGECRPTC